MVEEKNDWYAYCRMERENAIQHFGILGMKWGIRRYQNKDGTLTPEGKARYAQAEGDKKNRINVNSITEMGELMRPVCERINGTISNDLCNEQLGKYNLFHLMAMPYLYGGKTGSKNDKNYQMAFKEASDAFTEYCREVRRLTREEFAKTPDFNYTFIPSKELSTHFIKDGKPAKEVPAEEFILSSFTSQDMDPNFLKFQVDSLEKDRTAQR